MTINTPGVSIGVLGYVKKALVEPDQATAQQEPSVTPSTKDSTSQQNTTKEMQDLPAVDQYDLAEIRAPFQPTTEEAPFCRDGVGYSPE